MLIDMLVRLKGLELGRFNGSPLNSNNGSNDASSLKDDDDLDDLKDEFNNDIDFVDVNSAGELTDVQFVDKIKVGS